MTARSTHSARRIAIALALACLPTIGVVAQATPEPSEIAALNSRIAELEDDVRKARTVAAQWELRAAKFEWNVRDCQVQLSQLQINSRMVEARERLRGALGVPIDAPFDWAQETFKIESKSNAETPQERKP